MEATKIVLRSEARSLGLKRYFTGSPCNRGHISQRQVASGRCMHCAKEDEANYRARFPDREKQASRLWYAKNKDVASAWKKKWIAENQDRYRERRKRYRSSIQTRAKEMFNSSRWSAKDKGIPFDLDHEWILRRLTHGVCELTGIAFKLEPLDGGRQNPYTASLDRIVPELGYVKSNVRMILWALNAAFNSYGEQVYADIARVYLSKNGTGLS